MPRGEKLLSCRLGACDDRAIWIYHPGARNKLTTQSGKLPRLHLARKLWQVNLPVSLSLELSRVIEFQAVRRNVLVSQKGFLDNRRDLLYFPQTALSLMSMTSRQKNEIRQALQILRYSYSLIDEVERVHYAKIAEERILKVVERDDHMLRFAHALSVGRAGGLLGALGRAE